MEDRHHHRNERDEDGHRALELVGRALFLLDVFLGLLQARGIDVGAELGALGLVVLGVRHAQDLNSA